jgi:addiction module RelE/StbE family toxin
MKLTLTPDILKELNKIKQKDRKLVEKIEKQLILFKGNPRHPSLRLHKLTGNLGDYWSISITKSIRMIYEIVDEDIIYFIDIGTHDEVYKK